MSALPVGARQAPKHNKPVSVYLARAKGLWADLQAAGVELKEILTVVIVLHGLPPEYDTMRQILLNKADAESNLTLDNIYQHLLTVEQQHTVRPDAPDAAQVLMARDTPPAFPGRRPSNLYRNKICHYCHKRGHIAAECRQKARDLQQGGQATGANRTLAYTAAEPAANTRWVLDSGATRHMTSDKKILLDFHHNDQLVRFGNCQLAQAEGSGTVLMRPDNTDCNLLLSNVLYVPELACNLFSVRSVTSQGDMVNFQDASVQLGGITIPTTSADGLYAFTASYPGRAACLTAHTRESAALWHRLFGHLGYDNLAKLVKDDMVAGISTAVQEFKDAKQNVCEPCGLAKQHRQSFSTSESKAQRPLELVHMDVCGPMPEVSLGGNRYVATFLDDYTGFSEVKVLAHKSAVPDAVKSVFAEWETQTGRRLKAVHTDNGGECVNRGLADVFSSKGVVHQTAAPYTPEQNGAAERLNRTLKERTRAMLQDAGLPGNLWAEAFIAANYIRNRSPTSVVQGKTPLEAFTGRKPDVSLMRVFGCKAYVHVPKALRNALQPVSIKGTFIGYEAHSKAYRILLDNGQLKSSCNVVSDEASVNPPAVSERVPQHVNVLGDDSDDDADITPEQPAEQPPARLDVPAAAAEPPGAAAEVPAAPPATVQAVRTRSGRTVRPPGEWYKVSANVAAAVEPVTYMEAMNGPDADLWRKAMDDGIFACQWHLDT